MRAAPVPLQRQGADATHGGGPAGPPQGLLRGARLQLLRRDLGLDRLRHLLGRRAPLQHVRHKLRRGQPLRLLRRPGPRREDDGEPAEGVGEVRARVRHEGHEGLDQLLVLRSAAQRGCGVASNVTGGARPGGMEGGEAKQGRRSHTSGSSFLRPSFARMRARYAALKTPS